MNLTAETTAAFEAADALRREMRPPPGAATRQIAVTWDPQLHLAIALEALCGAQEAMERAGEVQVLAEGENAATGLQGA